MKRPNEKEPTKKKKKKKGIKRRSNKRAHTNGSTGNTATTYAESNLVRVLDDRRDEPPSVATATEISTVSFCSMEVPFQKAFASGTSRSASAQLQLLNHSRKHSHGHLERLTESEHAVDGALHSAVVVRNRRLTLRQPRCDDLPHGCQRDVDRATRVCWSGARESLSRGAAVRGPSSIRSVTSAIPRALAILTRSPCRNSIRGTRFGGPAAAPEASASAAAEAAAGVGAVVSASSMSESCAKSASVAFANAAMSASSSTRTASGVPTARSEVPPARVSSRGSCRPGPRSRAWPCRSRVPKPRRPR